MDIEVLFEGCLPACVIGMAGNRRKGRRGKALESADSRVCEGSVRVSLANVLHICSNSLRW
ncbi:hypothetical protein [Paraburkholderia sp. RL17-373-BIF-A]|uniref:hypothetical protein n=1 Tax=Paraburkholderia sp. RL17-373-BIF-A TaxID=3031629 RepID=UPI0038B722EA